MITYFARSPAQQETMAEVVGFAAIFLAGYHVLDPQALLHRRGVEVEGPGYLLDLIDEMADAVAYLGEPDGRVDAEVARQVLFAHDVELPVYRIIGRELVLETVPLRLAA